MVLPSVEREPDMRRSTTVQFSLNNSKGQSSRTTSYAFESKSVIEMSGTLSRFASAVKENDINLVTELLDNDDIVPGNMDRAKGCVHPLCIASAAGNEEVVNMLLERGFTADHSQSLVSARPPKMKKPNTTGGVSRRPNRPTRRRMNLGNTKAAPRQELRLFHAPIRKVETGEGTPLHWAAYKGNLPIVCALLRYGFDPCLLDTEGNNALHLASTGCNCIGGDHIIIMEILISEGVPVSERNAFGNTPYQLATDSRAKELLKRAMEETGTTPQFLSLSKLINAEEQLQKQLSQLIKDRSDEELRCEEGWDVFADGNPGIFEQIDSEGLGVSVEDEKTLRFKLLRTSRMRFLVESLEKQAVELEVAIIHAQTCFVQQNLVKVACNNLDSLKSRGVFEREILRLLERGQFKDISSLQSFIHQIRKAKQNAVAKHVLLRASRVYLYVESKSKLIASHESLEDVHGENLTAEHLNSLDTAIVSFSRNRIYFGKKKEDVKEKVDVSNTSITEDGGNHYGTKKKKKPKVAKKGKKGGKKGDKSHSEKNEEDPLPEESSREIREEKDGTGEEQSTIAIEGDPVLDMPQVSNQIEQSEDDILLEKVEKLRVRLGIEFDLLHFIKDDISSQYKNGSISKIAALESAIRKLDALLQNVEAMSLKPQEGEEDVLPVEGETGSNVKDIPTITNIFDPEIVAQATVRLKQLSKELKIAKRQHGEKSKGVKKPSTPNKPSTPSSTSSRRKK